MIRIKILILVVLALLLRITFALPVVIDPDRSVEPIPDARGYLLIAKNLLNGHGFSMSESHPYEPDYLRTPLYPLFIATIRKIFGQNPCYVVIIQIIISAFTPLIFLRSLKIIGFEENLSLIAAYLVAVSPLLSFLTALLLTETLFIALLFGSLACKKPLVRGLIMGMVALVRPIAIFGPILLAPFHKLKELPKLVCGFVIVITPWVARNILTSGKAKLSTIDDVHLLFYHAAPVIAEAEGRDLYEVQDSLSNLATKEAEDHGEPLFAVYRRVAIRSILSRPHRYLKLLIIGSLANLIPFPLGHWTSYVTGQGTEELGIRKALVEEIAITISRLQIYKAFRLLWDQRLRFLGLSGMIGLILLSSIELTFILLAIAGIFILKKRRPILLLWILYFLLLPGPYGHPRLRAPVEPLILIFTTATILFFLQKVRRPNLWKPRGETLGPGGHQNLSHQICHTSSKGGRGRI